MLGPRKPFPTRGEPSVTVSLGIKRVCFLSLASPARSPNLETGSSSCSYRNPGREEKKSKYALL